MADDQDRPPEDDDIIFPPGFPDEYKDKVRENYARYRMNMQSTHDTAKRFFNDVLEQDTAVYLKNVFASAGREPQIASYFEGYLSRLIEEKYHVCSACGRNHDEQDREFLDNLMKEAGKPTLPGMPVPGPDQMAADAEGVTENPLMPGFDMEGNRLALCDSCHGDRFIKVCEHPSGMHGQMSKDGVTCPEPTHVPCPECRTPSWYIWNELLDCPDMRCSDGKLLPLDDMGIVVCSSCGTRGPFDVSRIA